MLIKEKVIQDLKLGKEEALQEVYHTYHFLFSFCYFIFLRNEEKVKERLSFFYKALYEEISLLQDERNFETWAVKRIRKDAWLSLKSEPRFHGWNEDEIADALLEENEPFPSAISLDDLQRVSATLVWVFHFSISFVSNYLRRKASSILLALKTAEKELEKNEPGKGKEIFVADFHASFTCTIPYQTILETIEIQDREQPKKKLRGPLKSLLIIIALSVATITGLSIYESVRQNRFKNNPYGLSSQTKTIYSIEKRTRSSHEELPIDWMTKVRSFIQERSKKMWEIKENQLLSPMSDYLTLASLYLGDQGEGYKQIIDTSLLSSSHFKKLLSYYSFDFNADKDREKTKKNSRLYFQSSLWIDRTRAEGKPNAAFLKWSQDTFTEVFATQFTRNQDIKKWLTYYISSVDESFSIDEETTAIYYQTFRFRDAWKSAFPSVHYDDFYVGEGDPKQVIFMEHPSMMLYYQKWNAFDVIRIETEENIPITFFVPQEENDFTSLADQDFTSLTFDEPIACHFSLPQFMIENTSSLAAYLKEKGITPSFSTFLPDVPEVSLGEQYHAFTINENGIGMAHKNPSSSLEPATYTFTIDRPFAFMVGEGFYVGVIYHI